MSLKVKLNGITKRWLVNVLIVVLSIVFIFILLLSLLLSNYYYNTVDRYMNDTLENILSKYSSSSTDEYMENAYKFVSEYTEKSKMEVQFINTEGNIFVSTSGYIDDSSIKSEYESASKAETAFKYVGKNSAGEKIMAFTNTVKTQGEIIGAVRCVASLEQVDHQIFIAVIATVAVGALFVLFTVFLGFYFVGTIVKPIKEVGLVARRIALGDFDAKIEVSQNDEIGELCDTINFMAGELKSTEKIKNDFISSVSHELRTPLTAIKGWSETIKSAAGEDKGLVEKGMDVIMSESERLSALVEEMLDLSRLQSGQMSFKMEKIDILAELAEAVIIYEETAKSGGKQLIYNEPSQLPLVLGDGNRLKQVFINILDNALKYTEPGGKVEVSAEYSDGYIKIAFSDNGCGIPETELDKVKERFYKASNSVRGSGVGLAVADEIVRKHNGLMALESEEGKGTTVTIMLPAEPEKEETESQS